MMLKESCFERRTVSILFCSDSAAVASDLAQRLSETAILVRRGMEVSAVCAYVRNTPPDIILLDFQSEDGASSASKAAVLASALQQMQPDIPLAAVCHYQQPRSA